MEERLRELSLEEIDVVGGGISDDTGYATSIAVSVAFVGLAIATGGWSAIGFAAASYVSTGMAIHYGNK